MPLLISALLLAVWLSHPWTYVDLPRVTDAQAQISLSHSYTATMTVDPDVSLLKRSPTSPTSSNIAAQPRRLCRQHRPLRRLHRSRRPRLPRRHRRRRLKAWKQSCSYSWPCDQTPDVARCESGVDRAGRLDGIFATSGSSYGLFQLNGIHARRFPDFWEKWMDPVTNVARAYQIWTEQGWRPGPAGPEGVEAPVTRLRAPAANASCRSHHRSL